MNKIVGIILSLSLFACSSSNKAHKTSESLTKPGTYTGIYALNDEGPEVEFSNSYGTYKIDSLPCVSLDDVVKTKKEYVSAFNRTANLIIYFNQVGTLDLAKASKENLGKKIIVVYNSQLLLEAIVNEPITKGNLLVSGLNEDLIDEIVHNFK